MKASKPMPNTSPMPMGGGGGPGPAMAMVQNTRPEGAGFLQNAGAFSDAHPPAAKGMSKHSGYPNPGR